MDILIGVLLLVIGAVAGYAYFRKKYKADHMLADPDFIECQTDALGKPVSNKDHAVCYVDKKMKKAKAQLNIVD